MDTPLPIFGVNTGWHVSRIAKRILAGCAVYLPALIYSFGKYGFFFTYPLASLRNRNRKAYAVVRTCPYTRAPVSRSTKCVSLPVMPGSRPDNRYARRVDRQICVWITHKFITTSSERMLAFTGEWYRGLMPTLGGGGLQAVGTSRVRVLLNLGPYLSWRGIRPTLHEGLVTVLSLWSPANKYMFQNFSPKHYIQQTCFES